MRSAMVPTRPSPASTSASRRSAASSPSPDSTRETRPWPSPHRRPPDARTGRRLCRKRSDRPAAAVTASMAPALPVSITVDAAERCAGPDMRRLHGACIGEAVFRVDADHDQAKIAPGFEPGLFEAPGGEGKDRPAQRRAGVVGKYDNRGLAVDRLAKCYGLPAASVNWTESGNCASGFGIGIDSELRCVTRPACVDRAAAKKEMSRRGQPVFMAAASAWLARLRLAALCARHWRLPPPDRRVGVRSACRDDRHGPLDRDGQQPLGAVDPAVAGQAPALLRQHPASSATMALEKRRRWLVPPEPAACWGRLN